MNTKEHKHEPNDVKPKKELQKTLLKQASRIKENENLELENLESRIPTKLNWETVLKSSIINKPI